MTWELIYDFCQNLFSVSIGQSGTGHSVVAEAKLPSLFENDITWTPNILGEDLRIFNKDPGL